MGGGVRGNESEARGTVSWWMGRGTGFCAGGRREAGEGGRQQELEGRGLPGLIQTRWAHRGASCGRTPGLRVQCLGFEPWALRTQAGPSPSGGPGSAQQAGLGGSGRGGGRYSEQKPYLHYSYLRARVALENLTFPGLNKVSASYPEKGRIRTQARSLWPLGPLRVALSPPQKPSRVARAARSQLAALGSQGKGEPGENTCCPSTILQTGGLGGGIRAAS